MDNHDLQKPLLGDSIVHDEGTNIDTTTVTHLQRSNDSEQRQEDDKDNDDDDDVQAVWFLCSLKVTGSDDEDVDFDDVNDLEKNLTDKLDDDDGNHRTGGESCTSSKWYWNCFISSILPLLLYFQFYITYHYNDSNNDSEQMIMMTNDWSSIQWSIFLFVVTSVLYRQSMAYQLNNNGNSRSGKESSISYCELILHLVPDIIIDVLLILILLNYYVVAVLVMQLSTIFLAVNAIMNSCNCSIYIGATTSYTDN
jgi:hypothetical protein